MGAGARTVDRCGDAVAGYLLTLVGVGGSSWAFGSALAAEVVTASTLVGPGLLLGAAILGGVFAIAGMHDNC